MSKKDQVRSIFESAIEIASSSKQREFVLQACSENPELLRRVEALLEFHDKTDCLLEETLGVWQLDEPIGSVIGSYKLLKRIGEGGMGVVYVAEQQFPVRRLVALKIVKPGMDSKQVIARFEAERQALALMHHPNIAHIFDGGVTESKRPFFVMELIRGVPITEYCDQNRLGYKDRLDLFVSVCRAIQHAHQKGVIHRDIKPSNILVTLHDGKPVAKVIDFGIAKALNQELTQKTIYSRLGDVIGTPMYMSPEQAEMSGLDIDTRTDIYSLSVLLYEMLTGTLPFEKERLQKVAFNEVLRIIREEEPAKPSLKLSTQRGDATVVATARSTDVKRLVQQLRGELDWIVMKGLEKDRTRRYTSAEDLALDIERFLNDEAVLAGPPSKVYRLRKFASRHALLFWSSTLVATFILASLAVCIWFAVVTEQAWQGEKKHRSIATREAEKAQTAKAAAIASQQKTEATLARSNYFLANARWDANRVVEARQLLELVPEKHRNIEWYLSRRQFSGSYITCYGHRSPVRSVSFSPDGTQIASASDDRTIKLWDVVTGAELKTLSGHKGGIESIRFSPDGTQIASAGNDTTIKLWDVESGAELKKIEGNKFPIRSISFSPDGSQIVSAGVFRHSIKVWDVVSGAEKKTLEQQHRFGRGVYDVSFSTDGSRIASINIVGEVTLWDSVSGTELRQLNNESWPQSGGAGSSDAFSVNFSPDGARIASASRDNTIKIWNVDSGAELKTLSGHTDMVSSIEFSPDGSWIASASFDNSIKIWDAASGVEQRTLIGHGDRVNSISFSPDGTRIASASRDNTIKLWDVADGSEMTLSGHSDEVNSISHSADGSRIASASRDHTIKLWDTVSGIQLRTLNDPTTENIGFGGDSTGPVSSVSFSPDGTQIASASWNNTIKLWNAFSGAELKTLSGHTGQVNSVSFSPDGTRLASASSDETVKLWDVVTGIELKTLSGHVTSVTCVTFSPDGSRIASGEMNSSIKLWDAISGAKVLTLFGHLGNHVTSISFSPNGTRIAAAGLDKTIDVWDAGRGTKLKTLNGHTERVSGVTYSPDGTRIVSSSDDGTIKIWDAFTGTELKTIRGQTDVISGVSFSPDGTRIASASRDKTIKLWNAGTSAELKTLGRHASTVFCATFSPDRTRIASASGTRSIKIWDSGTGAELKTIRLSGLRGAVSSISFSPDATEVYVQNFEGETTAWNANSDAKIPDGRQNITVTELRHSLDGRWLLTPSGNEVLLVDLEFKNRPEEKARRHFKSRRKPHWHEEQAVQAAEDGNWYSATFHRAWAMKAAIEILKIPRRK